MSTEARPSNGAARVQSHSGTGLTAESLGDGLPYTIMDVFADRVLEGNALAIFPDARGLDTEMMQRIARETNLSETAFILPRSAQIEDAEGVRVRIFTTEEELPFAGHPTLGTAAYLHLFDPLLRGCERINLALNVGTIPVRFDPRTAEPGVFGTMRQQDPVFGAVISLRPIADAIGLSAEDLDPTAAPQIVSTGNPFCIVLLRSLDVAAKLAIDQRRAQACLDRIGARFFYCIVANEPTRIDAHFHARMQFHGGEDPATGSAAGCAIAWLVEHGRVESGRTVVIEQGIEMGRPSRLFVSASRRDGRTVDVFVGGRTIPAASCRLFLPQYTRFQQAEGRDVPV